MGVCIILSIVFESNLIAMNLYIILCGHNIDSHWKYFRKYFHNISGTLVHLFVFSALFSPTNVKDETRKCKKNENGNCFWFSVDFKINMKIRLLCGRTIWKKNEFDIVLRLKYLCYFCNDCMLKPMTFIYEMFF